MLNISSVLKFIRDGVQSGMERYVVVDDEHIIDNITGLKLHIYDDWFKFTHDGDLVATMRDFDTNVEQPLIWEIKALITRPETIEQRKSEYLPMIKKRRGNFSNFLENPTPVTPKHVVMEDDTDEYTG